MNSTDERLAIGSLLGPYKIVRLIGKGGMGEVYEAYEELLHRRVAVKIISEEAINAIPGAFDLFVQEGKALAQLNHPNVVTIYQLGSDKGIFYIAMEYVDGVPLNEHMKKKRPNFTQCLYIFNKILLGVRALHRKGVIHRDLKPKNIIIQENGKIKLVDFGIAQLVSETKEETKPTMVMGSVHYMSPEVARGETPTVQSDIWSLGIILYQMMQKERPFGGPSRTAVLTKVKNDELTFTSFAGMTIPKKYQMLIEKMCSKSLHERYQSINEILNDMEYEDEPSDIWNWSSGTIFATMGIGIMILFFAFTNLFSNPQNEQYAQYIPDEEMIEDIVEPRIQPLPEKQTERKVASEKKEEPKASEPPPEKIAEVKETPEPQAKPKVEKPVAKKPKKRAVSKAKKRKKRVYASKRKPIKKLSAAPRWSQNSFKFKVGPGSSEYLQWDSVAGASKYKITIAKDRGLRKIVSTKTVTGTKLKLPVSRPSNYYAQVVALDSRRKPASAVSAIASIKLEKKIVLAIPSPKLPMNNIVVPSQGTMITPIACSWSKIKNATNYEFQLSTDSGFGSIKFNTKTSETQFVITSPLQHGKFYWRVRAIADDQTASEWSAPRAFILK